MNSRPVVAGAIMLAIVAGYGGTGSAVFGQYTLDPDKLVDPCNQDSIDVISLNNEIAAIIEEACEKQKMDERFHEILIQFTAIGIPFVMIAVFFMIKSRSSRGGTRRVNGRRVG